tara:strand:- start:414 stop:632 length:219 start_codon:yes stop_codon:yes gene_type:complete
LTITEKELMEKAMAALLRGDYKERDRLCMLARQKIAQRVRVKEGGPADPGEPIEVGDLVQGEDGVFTPRVKE